MKPTSPIKGLSLISLSLLAAGTLHAGTASVASGNWSDSGTWNNGVPVGGASVGIVNGNTVTFDSGTWSGGDWPNTLQIGTVTDPWGGFTGSGAGTLNVGGTATLTAGWAGLGVNVFGAPVANQGILNISGGATVNFNNVLAAGWGGGVTSQINVSGGTLNLSGSSSEFNLGSGGAAELNISGTGDVNLNRGLNVQNSSTVGISGGTFAISNAGSLNVTSGTVTVNGGAVTSGNGQDFIGNGSGTSGILNISSGSFSKSGNTLFLGWADGTGTVNQSGGSATVNELWLGNGGVGTGTYNLSGGTLTVNSLLRFGVFDSGAGVFNQTGGTAELVSVTPWTNTRGNYNLKAGTLKALGNLNFTGAGPAPYINLNLTGTSGNATVDTNGFNITAYNDSIFNNAAATLNKTGAGTLLITSDGASPGQLSITNGALAIQNGTLETSSTITVGNGGTATGSISGGTLKTGYIAASNLIVGLSGGTGTVTQTAGAVDIGSAANVAIGWSGTGTYNLNGGTFSSAGITYVGLFGGGVGTLNINSGTYNANNMEISAGGATSGTVNLAGPMTVSGNMSIQPGGVVNVNASGALTTPNELKIDGGTLKLGGGTVSVGGGLGYIRNSGTYDVNGQTVAAGSYEASYFAVSNVKLTNSSASAATINSWTGTKESNTVWFPSTGATIETVGNLTINAIVTDGPTSSYGFTKTGNGTLFLTNWTDYQGETIISAGTLSLSNPTLSDNATVTINGGTLNLNFEGEDQVDKAYAILSGGSYLTRLSPGQWGPHDGVGITGTGYLRIAQGYDSWAADFTGPALADTTRTGDPDNDGLSNAVEYALGLDPRYSNGSPGDASNGGKTITFTKGSEAKYNDKVTYQIETSTTLGAAPSPWTVDVTNVTDDTDTISITFPDGPVKNFARLKVILAP